jgi:hypothetical protein
MLLLLFSCSPHPLPPLGLVLVTVLVARRRRSLLVQLRRRLPRAHELVDLRGCDQQRAAARRDLPTFCKNAAAAALSASRTSARSRNVRAVRRRPASYAPPGCAGCAMSTHASAA